MTHEIFLTTRQTGKIRNAFANNISTDIKLSKAQSGSFDSWLANLEKIALTNVTIPLAKRLFTWIIKQFNFKK